jgi:hypothetical protein
LHCAKKPRARLRDLRENGLLVLRVTFDGIHQVGNQICTPLQLNFDLTLRRSRLLVERLNAVVSARAKWEQKRECEPAFHSWSFVRIGDAVERWNGGTVERWNG